MPAFDYYNRGGRAREILFVDALGALAQQQFRGNLWLVVDAGRYRNVQDFLPGLAAQTPVHHITWPNIEVRAYDPAQFGPDTLLPNVPQWARDWPSPLDEVCEER